LRLSQLGKQAKEDSLAKKMPQKSPNQHIRSSITRRIMWAETGKENTQEQ
jgi:hypothetical protein